MSATRTLLSVTLLLPPGVAASAPTGTAQPGVAPFLFVLAGALLATLLLRPVTQRALLLLGRLIGQWRARNTIDGISMNTLHDFIIPAANGGLAKIDHAVQTGTGVVCIQVRHYRGLVFGAAEDAQWSNVDGGERRRFLNPLVHAEGCRRALANIVPGVPVRSLVVFSGAPEFATARPEGILVMEELESHLARIEFPPSDVDDWDAVWLTLRSAARTDEATRKDYAAQLGFI